MQITVPANIGSNPLKIIIGGVSYSLGAGETVDVPEEIVTELYRMLDLKSEKAPAVEPPFVDPALEKINERLEALEQGGGGGSGMPGFMVTFDFDEFSNIICDKTYDQIKSCYLYGMSAYAFYNGLWSSYCYEDDVDTQDQECISFGFLRGVPEPSDVTIQLDIFYLYPDNTVRVVTLTHS